MDGCGEFQKDLYQGEGKRGRYPPAFLSHIIRTWVADFMLRQDAGRFMLGKYLFDKKNPWTRRKQLGMAMAEKYANSQVFNQNRQDAFSRVSSGQNSTRGHGAFENAQGHGGRHYPPLPQAMSIKNKGVLRVGVLSMQDLQKWAEQSQFSEDYKQFTLGTNEAAPQWLAEGRVNF